MAHFRSAHTTSLLSVLLCGCVQTSDLYAVRQWDRPYQRQPDDRPRLNPDALEAKASFVRFVQDECKPEHLGDTNPNHHGFAPNSWAHENKAVAICVQRIATYAADQCIMITRRQNVVAADANLGLGAVTLGSGLAAVGYALKGSSSDRLAATSLAGAAAASNTSRGFLPSNTNVKVSDLLGSAVQYAEFVGLTDSDLAAALTYETQDEHGLRKRVPESKEKAGDVEIIKLARVHDAVFAGCGANAYGVVPARKPYK